ncbi:MAG: hypothetical protein U9N59_09775 [Campylobacterota bacterium]|nr:hypothetical protein [Campylobacterota bacterium]
MYGKILVNDQFNCIDELKKSCDVYRVFAMKAKKNLESVEIINSDGTFRGFGKNTKKALKNASKVIKSYYKLNA